MNKLKYMHVAKVKEFLFKVINNICVCRSILFRWKLSNTKKCLYCNNVNHTFKHLIWECHEVNNFWMFLGEKLNTDITFQLLMFGNNNIKQNNMHSVLMYLIYKKFILDNDKFTRVPLVLFLKNELTHKIEIYNSVDITSDMYIPLKFLSDIL